jgi:uncharacterized protein
MQPVWNEPAFRFRLTDDEGAHTYLVASELHLGIENELARRGAFLRSRSLALADRLAALARAQDADRLILLGDVKHRVTHLTPQERRDVPAFFERLSALDRIDIAVGNHDAGLRSLLPRTKAPNVRFHPAGGFLLRGEEARVACLHGHAWPRPALLAADTFLVGHTHAAVALVDEQGRSVTEWAWVRGRLDPAKVRAKYGRRAASRVVVFPPFNPLCGGTPVNRDGLLGPFAKLLEAASAEAYLLDGRSLGRLGSLVGSAEPHADR